MAGAGYRQWTTGQLVTADDMQNLVQDQVVMRFASAAARTAALPVPTEGMISTLDDSNRIDRYSGSAWETVWPGLSGHAVRASDDTVPAGTPATVGGVTVVGATGRRCIVTADFRVNPSTTTNLAPIEITNGTTVVRTMTRGAVPAGDTLLTVTWIGVATADTFAYKIATSAGTLMVRQTSAISVLVV